MDKGFVETWPSWYESFGGLYEDEEGRRSISGFTPLIWVNGGVQWSAGFDIDDAERVLCPIRQAESAGPRWK